jgi:hypothetical protein
MRTPQNISDDGLLPPNDNANENNTPPTRRDSSPLSDVPDGLDTANANTQTAGPKRKRQVSKAKGTSTSSRVKRKTNQG